MDLNVDRLIEAIRSVGCDAKQQGTEYYIMMPGNFPWYGDKDVHEIENSRIIASISVSGKWSDAWPMPDIRIWENEPLGVEMRKGPLGCRSGALDALSNFNYEQVTNWLHNKICEVSNKAKEYRRMLLEYQSKDYEV